MTGIGNLAVVPYRAGGDFIPTRGEVVARSETRATIASPGYPPYNVTLGDVHVLTPAEYGAGLPTCDPRVFPSRCPDGTCGSLATRERSILSTCTCTGAFATGLGCACGDSEAQFGCQCSSTGCSCPGDALFAAALYALLTEPCECYVEQEQMGHAASYGVPNGTHWLIASQGRLLEIQVPGCDLAALVYDQFGAELAFEGYCVDNATLLEPLFSLWDNVSQYAVLADAQPLALWSPSGIPVWRTGGIAEVTSSNGQPADLVLETNRSVWYGEEDRPNYIRLRFSRPYDITALYLNLVTAGVPYVNGTFPVQLTVLAQSPVTLLWTQIDAYVSSVVNGTDAVTLFPADPGPWLALELGSVAYMAVRSFIPYTDQACNCSATVVPFPFFPPVDASQPCVCENSCLIRIGTTVLTADDGVCSEARGDAVRMGLVPGFAYSLVRRARAPARRR